MKKLQRERKANGWGKAGEIDRGVILFAVCQAELCDTMSQNLKRSI